MLVQTSLLALVRAEVVVLQNFDSRLNWKNVLVVQSLL